MAATTLRFLSWNLALLERSAQAPISWEQHDTEAAVRDTVLEHAPDIVLYQELPGLVPFVETHDMVRANPRTHSGNLAALLAHRLMDPEPQYVAVDGALLTTLPAFGLTVANVHLAPGPAATGTRLSQLAAVVEASPTDALVVIGDTNTRLDEIAAIESAGLVAPKPVRPTWDSRRNRYRSDGAAFKAYFTRWFHSPELSVVDAEVLDAPTVRDGCRFHLSDHFAVAGSIRLA